MSADGTRLLLTYVADQVNVWLRFGHPRAEMMVDAQRRWVELPPHALCCRVRWHANAYGTVEWRLAVLQTCAPGEATERLVGVLPGAALLLNVAGSHSVSAVLALIDQIEAAGIDPAHSSPDYWRVVHQRVCVRVLPPRYTLERHQAFVWRAGA